MEERKIQLTGRSSFIITLPKEWVISQGIKKNDRVYVKSLPNGNLVIIPKVDFSRSSLNKTIRTANFKDPSLLFRLLVSAYLTGYSEIRVEGELDSMRQAVIREFVNKAIGLEVIEEGENYLLIRDVLSPNQIPFEKSLNRMLNIIKRTFKDLVECMDSRDPSPLKEIKMRDDEIDRIHWLITRQYHITIRNIYSEENKEADIIRASNYFIIARYLERIGDHLNRISMHLDSILFALSEEMLEKIKKGMEISLEMIKSSIDSFLELDIDRANKIIEEAKELNELCERIRLYSVKYPSRLAIPINYIIESIKRVGEYSADISEKTLDYWIERY